MSTSRTQTAFAPPTDGHSEDPAVKVGRLGYVAFATPDVARLTDYYTKTLAFAVVEESPSQVFLTTTSDHHCVVIDRAEAVAGRTYVGYEISGSLDDAEKRLDAIGLTAERRTDISPGTPDVLVLEEPGTGVAMHLYESQTESG